MHRSPWDEEIDFLSVLGGKGGTGTYTIRLGKQSGKVLEETTGKGMVRQAFTDKVKTWHTGNAQKSTRMIPVKTLSNTGHIN